MTKTPYTDRNIQKATRHHKNATKTSNIPLYAKLSIVIKRKLNSLLVLLSIYAADWSETTHMAWNTTCFECMYLHFCKSIDFRILNWWSETFLNYANKYFTWCQWLLQRSRKYKSINKLRIGFVFVGIGIATIVVDFLMNSYYIIILAWSAFYFVQCFSSVLPWATCGNAWNTDR